MHKRLVSAARRTYTPRYTACKPIAADCGAGPGPFTRKQDVVIRIPTLFRRILDPVTRRIPVPILSGMNRGRLWSLASAGGGYAMGTRSSDQMQVLAAMLREGDVVWDIGAHHGYVSLAASRAVGETGVVHAFEPSADNAKYLHRHLHWNAEGRVIPHQFALGAENGTVSFGGGDTSKMHRVGGGGERVEMRRADSLVSEGLVQRPDVIKIDVEGGELNVLESLLPILPDNIRGTIATHSRALAEAVLARLEGTCFTVLPSVSFSRMFRSREWDGDPDLFVFGPTSDTDGALRRSLRAMGAVGAS